MPSPQGPSAMRLPSFLAFPCPSAWSSELWLWFQSCLFSSLSDSVPIDKRRRWCILFRMLGVKGNDMCKTLTCAGKRLFLVAVFASPFEDSVFKFWERLFFLDVHFFFLKEEKLLLQIKPGTYVRCVASLGPVISSWELAVHPSICASPHSHF